MNSLVSLVCGMLLFQALELLLGMTEFTQRFNIVTSGVTGNIGSESAFCEIVAFRDIL